MTAMEHDLQFEVADVRAYHLAFGDEAGYWQSYRSAHGAGASAGGRFEFRAGWQTVYAAAVETPLVRVELATGEVGWGESNTPIAPEIVCLMLERAVAPMVQGRRLGSPVELWDFVYDSQRGRGVNSGYWMDALAAVDIALWDALGKRHGEPVARLLVEGPRRRIPVYQSGLRQATLDERIEFAQRVAAEGVRGVKLFPVGSADEILAELDGLMQACPDIEQWMVDTLWMCDYASAVRLKHELGERGVRFFECPLQPEDLAGHRALVQAPGAPIALGEHFRTRYQLGEWLQTPPALDVYQPDIGRTGISDFVRQRNLASRAGIPTTPHMGNGVSVFQAATLHCAAVASSELLQEYQSGLSTLLSDATSTSWRLDAGEFRLPDAPGLGVEVDEAGLAAHVVAAAR